MRRWYEHRLDWHTRCHWDLAVVEIGSGEARKRAGVKALGGLKQAPAYAKRIMWRRCVELLRGMTTEEAQ